MYLNHQCAKCAKSVLILLGLTVAASATDATIHKKCFDLVVVLWT